MDEIFKAEKCVLIKTQFRLFFRLHLVGMGKVNPSDVHELVRGLDGLVGVSLVDDQEGCGKQLVGCLCLDPVEEFIKPVADGSNGITTLV